MEEAAFQQLMELPVLAWAACCLNPLNWERNKVFCIQKKKGEEYSNRLKGILKQEAKPRENETGQTTQYFFSKQI